MTLPLFVSGSVDAQNVKSLTLPKFIIDAAADLITSSSKLESLAIHEVRADLSFSGYNSHRNMVFNSKYMFLKPRNSDSSFLRR